MPTVKIAKKMGFFTLRNLYAELAGKLLQPVKYERSRVRADLEHVGAVILMIRPGFDLSTIRPVVRNKPNGIFKRGTCFPAALTVLLRSLEPLTIRQIATGMLHDRGIADPTFEQIKLTIAAIGRSFSYNEDRIVMRIPGRPLRWRLR